MAVSFFALRQRPGPDLIAQNEKTNSAAAVSENQQRAEPSVAQSNPQAPAKIQGTTEPRAVAGTTGDKKSIEAEKSGEARTRTETTELDASAPPSLKDSAASKQGNAAGVAGTGRPVFAPEPAPPPPAAKPALSENKVAALQKEEVTRRETQTLPQEAEKNQPRDEAGRHGPSRSNTTLVGSKRADGLMSERAEPRAKSKKDSDDEVETRTVSGKRFTRQGNAWIDSAYDSSRRTINVARGSEQFRALVADEPGIRTIAEKLNGAVIVVWNGRAYRIQ
jgi:hypothetical protein